MPNYPAARSILPARTMPLQPGPPSGQTSIVKYPEYNINRWPVFSKRPADGQSFDKGGAIGIPAQDGLFHVVFQFPVPQGQNGIIQRIANVIVGGDFADFSGDLIWQIAQNLTSPSMPLIAPNYDDIEASFGAINNPSEIAGIPIKENQIVALLVKNVGITVAGQQIGGRFGGYFYPVSEEPPQSGF